jgi:putative endopeptidase
MSETTKKQALTKLDAILKKIGYPDKWRDYSALTIDPAASAAENLRRSREFENMRDLTKIGKPVDRTEWGMSPPTVNAYYNPSINEIVFPAGILQPPQFDPMVDDAVNYGAIGMVIGHEITHGFDDEGRQYDAVGNLKDWWTADDAKKFTEKAGRVVKQYDGYVAVDTLHVNGKLTLGENLADLGGLTLAYHAWKLSLKGKPAPQPIDGFTPEQRFFLGYAQAWRRKIRPETVRNQVLSDPHSPAEWRVNGPVSNMQEFRDAFGCKTGDALVRTDDVRAVIW